jgi:putative ABC transport system permease protein
MSLRGALRALWRSSSYTATAVGTVGLTVALSATVFAIVDGVLFKQLPFRDPHQLFDLYTSGPTAGFTATDIRRLGATDARIDIAVTGRRLTFTHPDRGDVTIRAREVDSRFFEVIGVHPRLGGFSSDQFQAAPNGVGTLPAVVTDGFWRQWLGADPVPIGRVIDLVNARIMVVGVLPSDFVFPISDVNPTDMLLPWTSDLAGDLIVRLPAGVTADEVKAMFDATLATRGSETPSAPGSAGQVTSVKLRSVTASLGQTSRPVFQAAFGAAVLLVLLGALNMTALGIARSQDRARELFIHAALGARGHDLVQLRLAEVMAIGVAGGVVGLVLTPPILAAALAVFPDQVPLLKTPSIDWRVGAFAFLAALTPLILMTLLPAVTEARRIATWNSTVSDRDSRRTRSWGRRGLLATEAGVGIALVLAGCLVVGGFLTLRSEDVGFDRRHLGLIEIRTIGSTGADDERMKLAAFNRLRQVPEVRAVAGVGTYLLERILERSQFAPPSGSTHVSIVTDVPVWGAFFEIAGLYLIDGRVPTEEELATGRNVAVVNERLARAFWPNSRAVGQTLVGDRRTVTVIGVVEDARLGSERAEEFGQVYVPPSLATIRRTVFLIQTTGDPDRVARVAAEVLRRDLPGTVVRRAESIDAALLASVRYERFSATLLGVAGVAALVVVSVGVAGLVAMGVARRVREIGIRSALGARRVELVGMILFDQLRPVVAGVVVGLVVAWWAVSAIEAYVYRLNTHDPTLWVVATAILLSAAGGAAAIPAWRASSVSPTEALRTE